MSECRFCIRRDLSRFSSLLFFRSSWSPSSWFWGGGHLDKGWNKEAEKIKKCRNISSFSAPMDFSLSTVEVWWSKLSTMICMLRILVVALYDGSSIPLSRFRPLFRRSCYYAHHRDRSPAGHSLSFDLCWEAGTISWPHCDELVLLVFFAIFFLSLVLFVVQQRFLITLLIFFIIRQTFHAQWLFTRLDDVFSRLEHAEQRPSRAVPRLGDTNDNSGDESYMDEPCWRLSSKRTYKMKKTWGGGGGSDVGQFFVTGPTDAATKPSHFYCRICRKDVSVLTHGHRNFLLHLQGSTKFSRDQRLRLEMTGWEVWDYGGNAMSPAEVERQWEKTMRAPLVVRDREYPFSEDVIIVESGAVDPNLGIMSKVSSLTEVLRLGESYELVYQLWAQFLLSAVRVNMDVTWSRNNVLVSLSSAP